MSKNFTFYIHFERQVYRMEEQKVQPFHEVAYVHTDLDGAGCTILFRLAHLGVPEGDDTWRLFNVENSEIDTLVLTHLREGRLVPDTKIIFGDICARKRTLQKLLDAGIEQVQVLDHHKTNLSALDVYPNSIVWVPTEEGEPLESGTSVMYQYYNRLYDKEHGNMFPFSDDGATGALLREFVELVRLYDTYEWKKDNKREAKQLQVLFQLLGMERFTKKYVARFSHLNDLPDGVVYPMISAEDMEFVSRRIEMEEKSIEDFSEDDIYAISYQGKLGALVLNTRGANINELANSFLTKHPKYDFLVGFDLSGSAGFSFRSTKDNIDLGRDFAGKIGGGGHPKAAGAIAKPELVDHIVDILYDYLSEHGRVPYGT